MVVECDECEAALSDGSKVMLEAIMCLGSSFCVFWPMKAKFAVSAEEFTETLDKAWLSWAGPPQRLRYDPQGAHRSARMERWCTQNGIIGDPQPGEAHHLTGAIERKIEFFKRVFAKVCVEMQLVEADSPFMWSSRVTAALSNH